MQKKFSYKKNKFYFDTERIILHKIAIFNILKDFFVDGSIFYNNILADFFNDASLVS